ncbi:MAG TPA: xanthine dehydrogenase family protein [Clostridia bacterium]|nr:xanthine dehydrogenase family protein [Clostridia bacterium]
MSFSVVGTRIPRVDGRDKVRGKAVFAADLFVPGMLWGAVLYSEFPHAKILRVDKEEALKTPGVYAVLTADDVPGQCDWMGFPPLAHGKVRFLGDVVAVAAGENMEAARLALRKVKVQYEPLKPLFSPEEALAPGAPEIHEGCKGNIIPMSHHKIRKGDITAGFAAADVILEREYRTQRVEHSYLETEAVLAVPDGSNESMTVYTCAQYPFSTRRAVAEVLGLPYAKVRVVQTTVGGTFGGKEEVIGMLAARAALLAAATGRPVKMVNTREDSFIQSSKRHPFIMRYKIGLSKTGRITALEAELICDGGAYNARAKNMNWRASVHATGPYEIENVKVDVYGVYTNNVYGGAMRGYSSPQVIFAHETLMDEAAAALSMDPVEFRLKNCFRGGSVTATGQVLKEVVPLRELISKVNGELGRDREAGNLPNSDGAPGPFVQGSQGDEHIRFGTGLACCFRGCGLGAEYADATGAMITIQRDGSVYLASSLSEVGQGLKTALSQIAAEALGIRVDRIVFADTDTSFIQDGGSTVASRGTYIGGRAVLAAAKTLLESLKGVAGEVLGCPADQVEVRKEEFIRRPYYCDGAESTGGPSGSSERSGERSSERSIQRSSEGSSERRSSIRFDELITECAKRGVNLSAVGWFSPGPVVVDRETGQGNAYPDYSFGCVGAKVAVDTRTGRVRVLEVVAGHDVGRAINPDCVEGQVYGGVAMGSGFALMENFRTKDGRPIDANLDTYLLPTSLDVPDVKGILFETGGSDGPYTAKSLAEPATEMVGAAIARAVSNALGVTFRELPITPERVVAAASDCPKPTDATKEARLQT